VACENPHTASRPCVYEHSGGSVTSAAPENITTRVTRCVRMTAPALFASVLLILYAAPSDAEAFGPETFEAGTCVNTTCTYASVEADHGEAFTQAAGHPPWGITKFVMKHTGSSVEGSSVKRIRVDLPPGLAANPQAPTPKCSLAQFQAEPKGCPAQSVVGSTEMEAVLQPLEVLPIALALSGTVYNLEPPPGLPLDFGIAIEPAPVNGIISPIRILLEGHLAWWSDYHEYFEIDNVPNEAEAEVLGKPTKAPLKVLMSKLNFNGRSGGDFLTLPSTCSSSTTSRLELESWTGEIVTTETHTPVGVSGCGQVPFSPSATIVPETAQSDSPDGASAVVRVPQQADADATNTSDIQDARVTLPEGLTLNPSAAYSLEACTASEIRIGETGPVECPAGSKIGTVAIETDLPPGSLTGNVYLGSPGGGAITEPPYTIYLDAESPRYGVSIRLRGSVTPNSDTGQLEVTFSDNPPLPFSELRLALNGGEYAPLANPLSCGAASTTFAFSPYSGGTEAMGSTPFETDGCPSPLPFSLSQSTSEALPAAGGHGQTSFTFNLARADGEQYLSTLTTALPAGVVGAIPSVTLCREPQAAAGTCSAASQIGTATVHVGAGNPYSFSGPVYLTGRYGEAPYGLSIPIHAVAGSFDLGTLVTRAQINVDPHSGRVVLSSTLPTIFKGIPLRLRTISVTVDRPDFLFNPTNCGALSTDTTLTSTFGATQTLSSPFSVSDCGALVFKPTFTAAASAHVSKADGASLTVSVRQLAHEANIAAVRVELPAQLPTRLSTLKEACPEATYAAGPLACPPGSRVGSATVTTPVLPDTLTGPAYLVSHGGGAFPDLVLLLEGDGVRIVLEGETKIKDGITTSTFPSIPDVPISSFALDLPTGPDSVLGAYGNLCSRALVMPTTITAQSGAQLSQNTILAVSGCPFGSFRHKVRILHRKIQGDVLFLTVQALQAGAITASGRGIRTVHSAVRKPSKVTLVLALSHRGVSAARAIARRHHRLSVHVGVTLSPRKHGEPSSSASTTVAFDA
jgi:hypothetical protein